MDMSKKNKTELTSTLNDLLSEFYDSVLLERAWIPGEDRQQYLADLQAIEDKRKAAQKSIVDLFLSLTKECKYQRGDIIKVGPWHGVVLDVLTSESQTVLEVDFVKNAMRQHGSEFVPVERVERLATRQEAQEEFEQLQTKQDQYFDVLVGRAND